MDFKKKRLRFLYKKKDSYYSKDYCYEKLFEQYNDTSHYHTLISSVKSKMKLKAQSTIDFNNKEFKNLSKKDILKQYGKPKYRVITNEKLKTEMFFYRLFIGGYKAKLELHFYNNNLFLYSYIFSYLNKDEKKQIVNLIERKYLNEQPFDYSSSIIIDDKQSCLYITESVDFTINYICSNASELFQNIESINSKKKLSGTQKQKNIVEELYQKL